ncbi:hypothetical protein EST38_g9569 [Candolleomyces aberdarensis]|uniref:Protein kinase domain-containing protein n=1 Tax=Candolleomyces aberdarensis TaxID=2316362 RepID=A0A4V1Q2U3_9AGAR|nr:hypothetical protein EST38_g9569 [Candolleomyces aberdarensis]
MGEFSSTLGALLVAVFINTYLYGVVSFQYASYYSSKFQDPRWVTLTIGALFVTDTFHSISIIYMAWVYAVLILTRKYIIYVPLVAIAVGAFVGGMIVGIKVWLADTMMELSSVNKVLTFWLTAKAALDVSIAVILLYTLNASKTGMRKSDKVLNRLMRTSVQTGVCTSVFAILCMVLFLVKPGTQYYLMFGLPIPRVYTCTLLDTLISRDSLRNMMDGSSTFKWLSILNTDGCLFSIINHCIVVLIHPILCPIIMPTGPSTEDTGCYQSLAMPNPPAELEDVRKPTVTPASKVESAPTSPGKGLLVPCARADAPAQDNDQNQPPTAPKPPAGLEDLKNPTDSPTAKDKPAPYAPRKGRLALKDLLIPEATAHATVQKRDNDQPKPKAAPSQPTPQEPEADYKSKAAPLPSRASVEKGQQPGTAVEEGAVGSSPGSPPYYPGSPPYCPGSPLYHPGNSPFRPESPPYFPGSPLYRPESPTFRYVDPLDQPKFKNICCELESHTSCTREPQTKLGDSLYSRITSKESIKEFFKTCPHYDHDRRTWKGMYEILWAPSSPGYSKHRVRDLTDKFFDIISSIMGQLGDYDGKRVLRVVGDTPLYHEEFQGLVHEYSSPTFVIQAEGPSFELPSHRGTGQYARKDRFGFTNITTCIDVVYGVSRKVILAQQAIYARQIFVQQPNRRFVRTLVLTENDVQLYHFDHSGSHCSTMTECPAPALIRIILGLSSLDEEVLGLDTSIQWTIDPETGRKESGTLTIKDDETKISKTYDLCGVDPSFRQFCIVGRGTTCWPLWDEEGQGLLIAKDCYRFDDSGCTPEFETLKIAWDLGGCARMVSYEANRGESVNGFGFCPCRSGRTRNQIFSRIVMEKYGKNLLGFESELQLLHAIRDSIRGHMMLFSKGFIHRDVHWSNVLLGKPDAPWGDRGILIDFDMAKRLDKLTEERWPTGHYQSLSITILRNAFAKPEEQILGHDWFDELESYFYMTSTIMYEFNGPNNYRKTLPSFIQEWLETFDNGQDYLKKNLEFKRRWILSDVPADPKKHVDTSYWSRHSLLLLDRFYAFTRRMAMEKERIRNLPKEKAMEALSHLQSKIEPHYVEVLYYFDIAIQGLEAAEDSDFDADSQTHGIKRELEDDSEEELDIRPTKRGRLGML